MTAIDAVRRSETLDRAFGYGHAVDALRELPSAQPETANVMIRYSVDGFTMWYACNACGVSIGYKDCYCRNCGRKLKHE